MTQGLGLLAMTAALTLAVPPGADGGAEPAGLVPRVLTVVLGLTAAALAYRALRRTRRR